MVKFDRVMGFFLKGTSKHKITGTSKCNACFLESFKRGRIGEKFATYCLSDHSDKHSPLTNYNQQKRERRFLLVLKDQVSAPSIDE
ncbi:MAG: hypothetical protein NTY13_01040, partial [Chlamydiae bacterium]|nr:hypothetical protein [Chlamydiota bacterium]